MSVIIFLQQNAATASTVNLVISFMLLSSLTNWIAFITLSLTGSVLGVITHLYALSSSVDLVNINFVIYTVVLSIIIGSWFIRHRQQQQKERLILARLYGSAIAHELRSPLGALQMQSEMLSDMMSSAEKKPINEYKVFNQYVHEYTSKSLQTIDMLLMAVKDELTAKDMGQHSMHEAVAESIEFYLKAYPMRRKQIKISSQCHDYLFYGSKILLEHIMLNLLNNAFRYGGDNVIVTIDYSHYHLYVSDNGKGMTKPVKDRAFDRFFTTSSAGTGIGLSFCLRAMEKMKGTITCDSKPNTYTVFDLTFVPYK